MSNKHHFPMSTSITHIDYNDEKKELDICFASGGTHRFSECPREIYEGLKAAESPGKHFHAHIRRAYKSEKVD